MTQIINEDVSMLSYVEDPPEEGAGSLSIRHENGIASYSTDGGKAWSDKAPSGFTQNADGSYYPFIKRLDSRNGGNCGRMFSLY